MRKFTIAFLRSPNPSLHSHAFLEGGPSLIFNTLASTPPAAAVGACKPGVSRTANGRKARELKADKLGCVSLHADIPSSAKAKRKAKATATKLSDIGVFKEDVIVLEEATAAQNAATGHAFLERGSLIFSTLASTPAAAEVGACCKPDVSMGALETRTANVRKARDLGCLSLHADIPSSAKAKATTTQVSDIGVFKADDVFVLEEASQNAATGQVEEAALHAKFVFEAEKAVQNAAIERSEEVANESIANAKKELSEWAAKLDLNITSGRQWEETAYKLLDHGISSAHVKKMLSKCRTLPCGKHSWDSTLQHLTKLGMSHEEKGRVISQCPTILNISNQVFQSKVEFFESIGIDRLCLGKIIHKAFRAIGLSASTLRGRSNFWKDYLQDVQENAFLNLISKNPNVLSWNLKTTVKPSIAFLEKLGFNKKMMLRCPVILGYRVKSIAMRLKLLEQFGISNARSRMNALIVFCGISDLTLHARLHNLLASGFSFDQVQKIIVNYPNLLAYNEDHINVRMRYAVNVMNLSFDMLVTSPVFWGYSFEKRMKYRYEVLQELKAVGAYEKNICLAYMVNMTDTKFSRRFTKRLQAYTKHSNI